MVAQKRTQKVEYIAPDSMRRVNSFVTWVVRGPATMYPRKDVRDSLHNH